RIVASVQTSAGPSYTCLLVRYNEDGSPASRGTVTGYQRAGVAVQPDGKVLMAGANGNSGPDVWLARFRADRTPDAGAALLARALAPPGNAAAPQASPLTTEQVQPLLAEAIARWQAAGVDTSAAAGVEVRVADLPGRTLGLASGNTIYLDVNAAGWGWFLD